MEIHPKCPNCGRNLTESELYCYFCEMEFPELLKEKSRSKNKNHSGKK